jgi:SPP1 gp7 family putative phage head morphogenesis protein
MALKPNAEYWAMRAIQREAEYRAGSEKIIARLKAVYERTFNNIENDIKKAAAKLEAYKDSGSAAAYLARLNSLEELKAQAQNDFIRLARTEETASAAWYAETMREGYYKTIFDAQKATGAAFSFSLLPERAVKETLMAGWAGRNYAQSVWRNNAVMAQKAGEIIESGFMSGASVRRMSEELNELTDAGLFACERLIRTETNYFSNQGELRAYEEAGIDRYEYLATLDDRTSQMCQEHDGLVYLLKDAVVGENYPPLHVFCRSTTVARFDGDTLEGLERRAKDPVTGEYYMIPADMNYGEWWEKYVANGGEADIINMGGDTNGLGNNAGAAGIQTMGIKGSKGTAAGAGGLYQGEAGAGIQGSARDRDTVESVGRSPTRSDAGRVSGLDLQPVTPETYSNAMSDFESKNENSGMVDLHTPEYWEESGAKLLLGGSSETGYYGAAVKPDGDITGVFSTPRGKGKDALIAALENGGGKLDAFGIYANGEPTELSKFYEKGGFTPVARVPFDAGAAASGFVENYGARDVVVFMHNGDLPEAVVEKWGSYGHGTAADYAALPVFTDYYAALNYRDELIRLKR